MPGSYMTDDIIEQPAVGVVVFSAQLPELQFSLKVKFVFLMSSHKEFILSKMNRVLKINRYIPQSTIRKEPTENRKSMEIKPHASRDSTETAHQNQTFCGRVGALFQCLFHHKKKKKAVRDSEDINVIPPAVTRDNVTTLVNKIETAGSREIVHSSEKKTEATIGTEHVHTSKIKTEATSGTDSATSCACLPRRKYRLGRKKCVPPPTTQEEPAEDRPHTREFVPQGSTPKGKHRLFFGWGKAFLCPPFCCRTKVDTEYKHEKDSVPTLIGQAETTSSSPFAKTVAAPIDGLQLSIPTDTVTFPESRIKVTATADNELDQKSTISSTKDSVETVPTPTDRTESTTTTESDPSSDSIYFTADKLEFTTSIETLVESKDRIEIRIPTETVPIPESGIEINAITYHEFDQKSTIPSTNTKDIVETVPTLADRTASITGSDPSSGSISVKADELEFTRAIDTVTEPKDRIESSCSTEIVPIQEIKTVDTKGTGNAPDGAVLPRGKIRRDDLTHPLITPEELEEDMSQPREESVQPFQQCCTSAGRGQPVVSKVKALFWKKIRKDTSKEVSQIQSDVPAPLTPESFNYYKILGEGMFGKVLVASHPSTDQLLAIKIAIKPPWPLQRILVEQQVMEATEGRRFFPQLFATFQKEGLLFYVMEYVNGGTLKRFIQKKKPLDKDTIKFIAAELLCAIQFLHSRDIAHCDIHTDNILLDSSGHVKIIDFGMAKIMKHSHSKTESAKDFQDRRTALHRDFKFFYSAVSQMSDLKDVQTYQGDDALLDLVKKSPFSFVHIRRHPFFAGMNWDDLEAGNISPPYVMEPIPEIIQLKKINVQHSMLQLRRRLSARPAPISEVDGFDFFSRRWRDMQQH